MLVNFKKECGIDTFSRERGGWAKRITGLNKEHSNGYSFEGDFIKLGNFDTNMLNGIYLDCSKTSDAYGDVYQTYHLFTFENGKIELLQTEEGGGWAVRLWDKIDEYFARDGITANQLLNEIRERGVSKEIQTELGHLFINEVKENSYPDYYNETYLKGIMFYMKFLDIDVEIFHKEGEKMIESLHKTYGDKSCKDDLFKYSMTLYNHREYIYGALGYTGINIDDLWNGKIFIEYKDMFEDGVDFNNSSTVWEYKKKWENGGLYFTKNVYTNNQSLCSLFMIQYDKTENVLSIYRFGVYFLNH